MKLLSIKEDYKASANPSFTQDIFTRHIRVDEYVLANITQDIFVPQDIFVYVLPAQDIYTRHEREDVSVRA